MLMPKKVKYRKQQRGRMTGKAWRGSTLSFGDYGLKVLEPGWVTDRQIEASRVAMTRFVKRGGKIWIRVFPDKPVTKKPAETRMGKGKLLNLSIRFRDSEIVFSALPRAIPTASVGPACVTPAASPRLPPDAIRLPSRTGSSLASLLQPSDPVRPCLYPYGFRRASS